MRYTESWLTLSGISTKWCMRWLRCCLADMEGIYLSRFEQENSDLKIILGQNNPSGIKKLVGFGWP